MRCRSLQFHIYTQLTNIKLQTQFLTTVTLLQFCVTKSPPFNITSLITVHLACNNTEAVNPFVYALLWFRINTATDKIFAHQ